MNVKEVHTRPLYKVPSLLQKCAGPGSRLGAPRTQSVKERKTVIRGNDVLTSIVTSSRQLRTCIRARRDSLFSVQRMLHQRRDGSVVRENRGTVFEARGKGTSVAWVSGLNRVITRGWARVNGFRGQWRGSTPRDLTLRLLRMMKLPPPLLGPPPFASNVRREANFFHGSQFEFSAKLLEQPLSVSNWDFLRSYVCTYVRLWTFYRWTKYT